MAGSEKNYNPDADSAGLIAPDALSNCQCCPRNCEAARTEQELGWCRVDDKLYISSICAHHGEEPVLSGTNGICNIFFSHCNMQCIYCQNYQISDNRLDVAADEMSLEVIADRIENILSHGAKGVGFVSPSHFVPQMRLIMSALSARGHNPTYVYNTNGYDKLDSIVSLRDEIDVYLPDFKYMESRLAAEYSATPLYSEIAGPAIREMYRQKGADLRLDNDGLVNSGLIIRHLVLPGHVENSKSVLKYIAEELSPDVYISLMSQYYPTVRVADHHALGRTLRAEEYEEVLDEFERLGFHRGFVQELNSPHHYRPDFMKDDPFNN